MVTTIYGPMDRLRALISIPIHTCDRILASCISPDQMSISDLKTKKLAEYIARAEKSKGRILFELGREEAKALFSSECGNCGYTGQDATMLSMA